jgi:hypothetical protein
MHIDHTHTRARAPGHSARTLSSNACTSRSRICLPVSNCDRTDHTRVTTPPPPRARARARLASYRRRDESIEIRLAAARHNHTAHAHVSHCVCARQPHVTLADAPSNAACVSDAQHVVIVGESRRAHCVAARACDAHSETTHTRRHHQRTVIEHFVTMMCANRQRKHLLTRTRSVH